MTIFPLNLRRLPEVFTIERARRGDSRGFLSRLFSADDLSGWGWDKPIAQINHTYTAARGTIRGMHFQVAPKAEKKIIMCLKGAVCDVAVDLRRGSPAFLRYHMETLSADNRRALALAISPFILKTSTPMSSMK